MKRTEYNVEQGSGAWFKLRLGIPTASQFKLFCTPKGKPAMNETRENYLADLVTERLTGRLPQGFETDAMKRGKALEPRARRWYKMETGRMVRQVGFIMRDGLPRCGYSPDGIVDEEGDAACRLIEVKCPEDRKMERRLRDGDVSEYALQMQAGMWIADIAVCDLVLFTDTPGLYNRIIEVRADPIMHAAFAEVVRAFCDEVDAAEALHIGRGAEKQPIQGSDEAAEMVMDSMAPLREGGRDAGTANTN